LKNILLIQPKAILKKIYPKAIWNFNRIDKVIYLTFDDGPIEHLTEWVLDELNKVGAKATFFCVGSNVERNPLIYNRIKDAGHQVANHTYSHVKGFQHTVSNYLLEIAKCDKLVHSKLFRPPYGQLKLSQYKAILKQNYKIILWDVISYDYEKINPELCLKNIIKYSQNGSVVLFHDNIKAEKNLKYALPLFLKHFKELGFVFKSIDL
jgi:peptidoglycan-N-acetylglucosamine deacetylase